MEQYNNNYTTLEELSKSDFQIKEGQPNIMGWKVNSETSVYMGQVHDLLFDPGTRAVRYLVIDLADNGMALEDKLVLVPIAMAHLHLSDDEVVLPSIHQEQFLALPAYSAGNFGPEIESEVWAVIGSPAALRMEDTTTEFDQQQFYAHHHFDQDRFYTRGGRERSDMLDPKD